MPTNRNLWVGLMLSACLAACSHIDDKHSYRPHAGMVPDKQTASLIAEAVLVPIYGKMQIERQTPFSVSLDNDTWRVSGSLPKSRPDEIVAGGVAEVLISKKSGAILGISHGE